MESLGLEDKEKIRPKRAGKATRVASNELDILFEIQHRENMAAILLQQFWRRYKKLYLWKKLVYQHLAVRQIQRMVRGMIVRQWVARWHAARERIAIGWQAFVRKWLTQKHVKIIQQHEQLMAIRIQRIVRGKLAANRYHRLRRHLAATRVQAMWRGVTDRVKSDLLWVNRRVMPIQTSVRRMLAKRDYQLIRKELHTAALLIQRQFRSWRSCRDLGVLLMKREMQYRMDVITILSAEEESSQETLVKLVNRLTMGSLRQEVESRVNGLQKQYSVIEGLEKDYKVLNRQRQLLSPRAIAEGRYKVVVGICES
jgi:hypothetical protein